LAESLSGFNTQPSKRSNGLAGGGFCAIAAALRQASTIKRGNIYLQCEYVQLNRMRSRQLHDALEKLYQGHS
jgi:hypothetical protein